MSNNQDYDEWAKFHDPLYGTRNQGFDPFDQYPDYPGPGNWQDPINDYEAPIGPAEAPPGWNFDYYPGGAGPAEAPPGWYEDHPSPYDIYMNDQVANMPIAPTWDDVNWNFPPVPTQQPGGMWGDEILNLPEAPTYPPGDFTQFNPPAENPNFIDYTGLVPVPPPDRTTQTGNYIGALLPVGKS